MNVARFRDMPREESAITPRRRRTGTVCGSLRVDGQPVTFEGMAAIGVRFTPGASNQSRLSLHDVRCAERHDTVATGWVEDICTSSWQRDCPFKPAAPTPVVRYTIGTPPLQRIPVQAPGAYAQHRLRVAAIVADRRIAGSTIAEDIGWSSSTVNAVLNGNTASERVLDAIEQYLTVARPIAPPPPTPKPVRFCDLSPEVHVARILASLDELGITRSDASRVLGMGDTFVSGLLMRKDRPQRLEELDAVLDVMLVAHRAAQAHS